MANIIPWLVSMSLIGGQTYGALSRLEDISRELEAPPISTISYHLDKPPVDFHRQSTVGNENFPRDSTCQHALPRDNLGPKKLPGIAQNGGYAKELPIFKSLPNGGFDPKTGRALGMFQIGTDPTAFDRNRQAEAYRTSHKYVPTGAGVANDENAGPAMELVYSWKTVDFEFANDEARDRAIIDGTYIEENALPLGVEVWKDKIFVTLPRWKNGIPATLATIPRRSDEKSPKLRPYPDWGWHDPGNCNGLTSVFRLQVDECDRLWVLDSGQIELTSDPKQICPPKIFVFDLNTDQMIRKFSLPQDQIKQDSLYSNIVVDVRNGECNNAVAYLSDVWRFGIVAYHYSKDESFRIQHHFFFPDPLSSRYELHGLNFQWTDGIFGISLSPVDINDDRTLFFHPLSSFREFAVSTKVLRDEKTADDNPEKFIPIGQPRAKYSGHSSGSAMDREGVMFFNMVTRDSVWCWDSRKEYIPQNLGVIGQSNVSLIFPNDIKVDHEADQSFWVLSNKLPMYLYGHLDTSEVNYRLFKANVKEAVRNTVCDPNYVVPPSERTYDETC